MQKLTLSEERSDGEGAFVSGRRFMTDIAAERVNELQDTLGSWSVGSWGGRSTR